MNTPLISVIIPVYNAEQFLSAALDSVLAQTYKNWELILIDDGSTDQSASICDQYAAQYADRIRVIHQSNKGVSAARNVGLSIAKGEFITFVDADDYVAPDYLQALGMCQSEKGADLVIIGVQVVTPFSTGIILEDHNNEDYEVDLMPLLKKKHVFGNVWGKLYRSSYIKDFKLEFCPEISFGEDAIFIGLYSIICKKVSFLSKVAYYYRRGHESLSWEAYRYVQKDTIYRIDKIRQFLERNNLKTEFAIGLIDFHYYKLLRTTLDRRWTFSETRDNLISMRGDKGVCGYLSQVKNENLTKLERFYVYILKRLPSSPSSCVVLLVFLLLRVTQGIGYMRSCWGKRCKCNNKM